MGTSFTEFRQHGFWTNDWDLTVWMAFVVREIEKLTDRPSWLDDLLRACEVANTRDGTRVWVSKRR